MQHAPRPGGTATGSAADASTDPKIPHQTRTESFRLRRSLEKQIDSSQDLSFVSLGLDLAHTSPHIQGLNFKLKVFAETSPYILADVAMCLSHVNMGYMRLVQLHALGHADDGSPLWVDRGLGRGHAKQ